MTPLHPDEVRRVAQAYAKAIFHSVDFGVPAPAEGAFEGSAADRIFTEIHRAIVDAWVAGYVAGSSDGPKEAA